MRRNAAALLLICVAAAYAPLFAPGRDPLDSGWTSERATYAERLRNGVRTLGRVPTWDPYHAGGVPFLAETHHAVLYPPTWLAVLLPVGEGIRLAFLLHLLVAAAGAWRLARVSGLGPWGGAAATLVYALGGYLPIQRWFGAHDVLGAAAWWPLLLSFLEEGAGERPRAAPAPAGPAAVAAAHLLLAGRPEIPYFALLGAGVYLCVRPCADAHPLGALRRGVTTATVAAVGAALLALPYLLALADYLPRVPRWTLERFTETGFSAFAYPWWWSPTLVAPYLFDLSPGSPWSHGAPWGRCWVGGAGAVFALLGLFRGPRRVVLPHAALAALGLLLSMGEDGPLGPLVVHLPLWTSLRGSARGLFVHLASLGLLVGIGVESAGAGGRKAPAVWLLVGGLLAALLAAPVADVAGKVLRRAEGVRAALRRADEAAHTRAREAFETPDGGAAFRAERRRGALWRTLRRAGGIGLRSIVAGVGAAAAAGGAALLLLRTGRSSAAAALLVGVELVALALPLTLPARPPPAADRAWRSGRPPLPPAVASPAVRVDGPTDLLAGTARGLHLVGTSSPFGYAPYVRLARAAPTPERLDLLGVDAVVDRGAPPPGFADAGPVDLGATEAHRLFVRERPIGRFRWEGAGAARVEITSYEPDRWRLEVDAPAPGRIVAADAFDPWWRALIDGGPAPVAKAHGALLSVGVPAGRSIVVLFYAPSFVAPAALGSAAAGLLLLAALVRGRIPRPPSRMNPCRTGSS